MGSLRLATALGFGITLLAGCGTNQQIGPSQAIHAQKVTRVGSVRPDSTIYWEPSKIVFKGSEHDNPVLYLPTGHKWGLGNDTCGTRVFAATINQGTSGSLTWYEWDFHTAAPGPFRCVYVAHDRVTKENGRLIVIAR